MTVPDASFILADRTIAFDALERKIYFVAVTNDVLATHSWQNKMRDQLSTLSLQPPLAKPPTQTPSSTPIVMKPSLSRPTYESNIATIQSKIEDGETYEVCLTNHLIAEMELADPFAFYKTLRELNPAPFAGFYRAQTYAICSSSPERFVSLNVDRVMESKPIKGTRKRDRVDLVADGAIATELQECVKDHAENMMIADLVRNDFGHVCAIGSVHVPKLMQVETYETVHQLVTTVRGQLQPTCDILDAIVATFPGGSMTGAPKKRTMELIRDLEQHPRGVYSGTHFPI